MSEGTKLVRGRQPQSSPGPQLLPVGLAEAFVETESQLHFSLGLILPPSPPFHECCCRERPPILSTSECGFPGCELVEGLWPAGLGKRESQEGLGGRTKCSPKPRRSRPQKGYRTEPLTSRRGPQSQRFQLMGEAEENDGRVQRVWKVDQERGRAVRREPIESPLHLAYFVLHPIVDSHLKTHWPHAHETSNTSLTMRFKNSSMFGRIVSTSLGDVISPALKTHRHPI